MNESFCIETITCWSSQKHQWQQLAPVQGPRQLPQRAISSAECKKVVSDIFGKIEFLMKYENIGLYAHFALFSRPFLSPFIFQNIKQNVFKNCHLRPYCTNIWQMFLMQEGRKCHLRPSCTNFRQMWVMQERHKCHLRPSCIKQLVSLNSPCFGFTPTVHTKNSFKWNIKTN